MEQEKLEKLFESIKKDDLKSFSLIMLSNSDLNISFGRFPILSLLYLYSSYTILSNYEKFLLPIHNYNKVFEPYDAYLDLKKKAKKSLRLFASTDEPIYPILMLAVLDERKELENNFKKLYKNAEIVEILSKIYKINLNLEINCQTSEIHLPPKKLSFSSKIIASVLCVIFAMVSVLSLVNIFYVKNKTGLGNASSPILISSEKELITAFSSKGRYYKLTQDIFVSNDFAQNDFDGTLDGDGHEIVLSEQTTSLLKTNSGIIKNLKISAKITSASFSQSFAILAEKNSGTIENVEISGQISFSSYNDEDAYFAGVVVTNDGTISDLQISLDAVVLNKRNSDTFFAGVAGENNGTILNVTTGKNKFETDTVDVSGIVTTNNGEIKNCLNQTEIEQTSSKQWHPHSSGIVINNYGTISSSINNGAITSSSTVEEYASDGSFYVFAGGIATQNYGTISGCENAGAISGNSEISIVYIGGIAAMNQATEVYSPMVSKSKSTGKISAKSTSAKVNVGGIVGQNASFIAQTIFGTYGIYKTANVSGCGYVGKIELDAKTALSGGLVAENYYGTIKGSYTSVTTSATFSSNDNQIYMSYLVGGTYLVDVMKNIISDNYYVKTSSEDRVINSLTRDTATNTIIVGKMSADAYATEIVSLDKLPEGVRLW